MNSVMLHAFRDEFEKIALLGRVGDYIGEGWHGPADDPNHWTLQPKALPPNAGMLSRGWEAVKRKVPIPLGSKALTVAFAAPEVYHALQSHDPTGQERSRTERLSGFAGSTLGGMGGAAAGTRAVSALRKLTGSTAKGGWLGMAGMLGGSMLGSTVGARLAGMPFNGARRRREEAYQQALAQPQQQPASAQPEQPVATPGVF